MASERCVHIDLGIGYCKRGRREKNADCHKLGSEDMKVNDCYQSIEEVEVERLENKNW